MNIQTAIILAAGRGSRLRSVTNDLVPKPLIPIEKTPLIEWSIQALLNAGVEQIFIGCGYLIESFYYLEEKYDEVEIVKNSLYDVRSSLHTFLMFENLVTKPFYLLEGDILYDPAVFKKVKGESENMKNLIVTSVPLDLDDNVYFTSQDGKLARLAKQKDKEEPEGVMTGIWMLSEGLIQRFSRYCQNRGIDFSEDYEEMLARYSSEEEPIMIDYQSDLNWCEIDNEKHLEYALKKVLPSIKENKLSTPNIQ